MKKHLLIYLLTILTLTAPSLRALDTVPLLGDINVRQLQPISVEVFKELECEDLEDFVKFNAAIHTKLRFLPIFGPGPIPETKAKEISDALKIQARGFLAFSDDSKIVIRNGTDVALLKNHLAKQSANAAQAAEEKPCNEALTRFIRDKSADIPVIANLEEQLTSDGQTRTQDAGDTSGNDTFAVRISNQQDNSNPDNFRLIVSDTDEVRIPKGNEQATERTATTGTLSDTRISGDTGSLTVPSATGLSLGGTGSSIEATPVTGVLSGTRISGDTGNLTLPSATGLSLGGTYSIEATPATGALPATPARGSDDIEGDVFTNSLVTVTGILASAFDIEQGNVSPEPEKPSNTVTIINNALPNDPKERNNIIFTVTTDALIEAGAVNSNSVFTLLDDNFDSEETVTLTSAELINGTNHFGALTVGGSPTVVGAVTGGGAGAGLCSKVAAGTELTLHVANDASSCSIVDGSFVAAPAGFSTLTVTFNDAGGVSIFISGSPFIGFAAGTVVDLTTTASITLPGGGGTLLVDVRIEANNPPGQLKITASNARVVP